MALPQSNRRLFFIVTAFCFVLLTLFTGHRNPDVVSSIRDKTLETVGLTRQHPPWLLATISPAYSLQRRTIIRSTWQRLYANSTRFTTRFVISNSTERWRMLIEAENRTYGDIIMLPNVVEDRHEANSIKPMTFFSYLVNTTSRPWTFVSKIDDDSFLDANAFWRKYLQPKLDRQNATQTVWGVKKGDIGGYMFPYPGGQFYTMTWDLLTNITTHWNKHGSEDTYDEDALIGALLNRTGVGWDFEQLPREGAYDFGGEGKDGPRDRETAWAQKDVNLLAGSHAVASGTFNVHKLKEDDDYLKVAACFDENGLKTAEWAEGFVQ